MSSKTTTPGASLVDRLLTPSEMSYVSGGEYYTEHLQHPFPDDGRGNYEQTTREKKEKDEK